MFHVPNKNRVTTGIMASDDSFGNNGCFCIQIGNDLFHIIASDGEAMKGKIELWEHVSVHAVKNKKQETPTWDDMCKIKDIFWDEEDAVVQYHPKKSEYVNRHPNVLHLWRPVVQKLPTPPKILVG